MSARRQIYEQNLELIQHINPSRLNEYYDMMREKAAVKIQSRFRGYLARKAAPLPSKKTEILQVEHNFNNPPTRDIQKYLEEIKAKATPMKDLLVSKRYLIERCKEVDVLLKNRRNRIDIPTLKHPDYASRVQYWVDGCRDMNLERIQTSDDPKVDESIRSAHKKALKRAKDGWWKESWMDTKWNERDDEFEAWMTQIQTGLPDSSNRFYY
jgi:hypothetical protein